MHSPLLTMVLTKTRESDVEQLLKPFDSAIFNLHANGYTTASNLLLRILICFSEPILNALEPVY
jgi:hypothetical protein